MWAAAQGSAAYNSHEYAAVAGRHAAASVGCSADAPFKFSKMTRRLLLLC